MKEKTSTIVACATPPGEGAIAVVRLSGPQALEIVQRCLARPQSPPERLMQYSRFVAGDGRALLDQVLWWHGRAPSTYTGEDTVEISFHGSPYIVDRAIDALLAAGATLAEPGEFTKRAFLNGKLDLSQAEAVIDMIQSRSAQAHGYALRRLTGGVGAELRALHERYRDLVSLLEAYLNFPEDIVDEADDARIDGALKSLREAFRTFQARVVDRRPLYEGIRVLLVGAPNVGKSSLFNRLIGFERALVSAVPGTTRDYIEAEFTAGGLRFKLMDQAGVRDDPTEELEAKGIALARELWEDADIVFLVRDGSRPATEAEHALESAFPGKIVAVLRNKADLELHPEALPRTSLPHLDISAAGGNGLDALEAYLIREGKRISQPHGEQTLHFGQQQREILKSACEALEAAGEGRQNGLSLEFLSLELREGLDRLGLLIGATTTDDLLNRVFDRFCIGK